eukprot:Platyproteum_vivax@DN2694_c0_g1_i2.p1
MCECCGRVIKLLYKVVTGKHEIERLCLGFQPALVENCLMRSKQLRHLQNNIFSIECNVYEVIYSIKVIKKIKFNAAFDSGIKRNLEAIVKLNEAVNIVNDLCIPYDSSNAEHEQLLENLWRGLKPNKKLEKRITTEWKQLGFQGDNPASDFRGVGLLSLMNLVALVKDNPNCAQQMLLGSQNSKYWYSFAITGINVTAWLKTWVVERNPQVQDVFYYWPMPANATTNQKKEIIVEVLNNLYAYIFSSFHDFWLSSKPLSIMQFGETSEKFKKTFRLPIDWMPGTPLPVKIVEYGLEKD